MSSFIKNSTPALAILSITILQALALQHTLDGTIFAASIAVIAGIAGYQIKTTH